jgi:hypothetical protein
MPPKKSEKTKDSMLKIMEKRKKCIQKHRNNLTKKNPKNPKQINTLTPVEVEVAVEDTQLEEVKEDKKDTKRCPKGTRRNKKTGNCEPVKK